MACWQVTEPGPRIHAVGRCLFPVPPGLVSPETLGLSGSWLRSARPGAFPIPEARSPASSSQSGSDPQQTLSGCGGRMRASGRVMPLPPGDAPPPLPPSRPGTGCALASWNPLVVTGGDSQRRTPPRAERPRTALGSGWQTRPRPPPARTLGLSRHVFAGPTPCTSSTQPHVNMCPELTRLPVVPELSYGLGNKVNRDLPRS